MIKSSPRACLGKNSDCCQHLGGLGHACAIHGLTHKDSGFYVLFKGMLKSTSRSRWSVGTKTWVNPHRFSGLVFDSIESVQEKKILKSPVELPVPFVIWRIYSWLVLMCPGYIVVPSGIFSSSGGWNQIWMRNQNTYGVQDHHDSHQQLLLADKRLLFTLNVYDQELLLDKKALDKNCRIRKEQWSDR